MNEDIRRLAAEEEACTLAPGSPGEQAAVRAKARLPQMQDIPKAQPERFPATPTQGAVPKQAVLYCILGLIIPGLPSLLLRDDKVVGCIQLGVWIVSWVLTVVLIGFLIWPAVAIWAAITGYQDAQLWNRRHGFVT